MKIKNPISLFLVNGKKKKPIKRSIKPWFNTNKVQRVIQFNQEPWLKPYIDTNTELRTETKNDTEKDFFKLMNNCVFWKSNGKCKKA